MRDEPLAVAQQRPGDRERTNADGEDCQRQNLRPQRRLADQYASYGEQPDSSQDRSGAERD